MAYFRNNRHGNDLTRRVKHIGKAVCIERLVIRSDYHRAGLIDGLDILNEVPLGTKVGCERKRIFGREECFGLLVQGEFHHRKIVEGTYSESIQDRQGDDSRNAYAHPTSTVRS